MKVVNVDDLSVEYIVIMKGRYENNENAVYTYKIFMGLDEVNEMEDYEGIKNKIVKYFEDMHPSMYVDEVITDISVVYGVSYTPRYVSVYPVLRKKF